MRFAYWLIIGAIGCFCVGWALSALMSIGPGALVVQGSTGRPPKAVALMALLPIAAVCYIVVAVKVDRKLFGCEE